MTNTKFFDPVEPIPARITITSMRPDEGTPCFAVVRTGTGPDKVYIPKGLATRMRVDEWENGDVIDAKLVPAPEAHAHNFPWMAVWVDVSDE